MSYFGGVLLFLLLLHLTNLLGHHFHGFALTYFPVSVFRLSVCEEFFLAVFRWFLALVSFFPLLSLFGVQVFLAFYTFFDMGGTFLFSFLFYISLGRLIRWFLPISLRIWYEIWVFFVSSVL